MRKSKIEAAETRQHIVSVASEEFRLNGIASTGVVPLMSKAGLTHGGFYKHFESKEQLVAEACALAVEGLVDKFNTASAAGGEQGFRAIIESYLSADHSQNPEQGCPLAAMGSELVRSDDYTRQVASQGFYDLVGVLAKSLGNPNSEKVQSQAVFAMAAMVGAVTVSRIMSDEAASLAVLNTVQQHLSVM
ncbi:TetR/AcrR family transcriptional regulator [Undibacterium terreum]|uniref:TetR family transcriptional regulator n=1 Tax=Undibacterium terreum TaxID=1224302 RepID=A0A916UA95_9BURK|nr:TetR/AcrR family transcriptional regulator [Undibacterium terreum]GGC66320.1 TetR family transcriptional regulator [Undibacterium terreum]